MNLWQGCYDPPPPKPPVQYSPKKLADETVLRVAQRVGDDEREWVARRLGEMWATGFLSQRERDEREAAASAAVTRGQLNVLLKDLPDDPGEWREIREVPFPIIKKADVIRSPKAGVPSLLMFFFALAAIVLGCVMMAVHQGAAVPILEDAAVTGIGIVTLLREINRM